MIQAIETEYAGVRFRSRLEARWAVFFDALGVRWEHEPEAFVLPSGARYLPDFWLPDLKLFAEVKPEGDSFTRARELASHERPVWLLEGLPSIGPWKIVPGVETDIHDGSMWCERVILREFGNSDSPPKQEWKLRASDFFDHPAEGFSVESPTAQAAVDAVLRHRFWDPKSRTPAVEVPKFTGDDARATLARLSEEAKNARARAEEAERRAQERDNREFYARLRLLLAKPRSER